MKTGTNRRWVVGCLAVVCAGGLFSCDTSPKKEEQVTAATASQASATGEEEVSLNPDPEKPPFNPRAGRMPRNQDEYLAALETISVYDSLNPRAIVTSNYFSDSLIRALIGKEGSATDRRVSGLRVYRTYNLGGKGFGVLISAVGIDGKEVETRTQLKDGFVGQYAFGFSEERCPHNCGRLEEQQ